MSKRKVSTYSAELKKKLLNEFVRANESIASFSKGKENPTTTFFSVA